jgi:hypothetical protein
MREENADTRICRERNRELKHVRIVKQTGAAAQAMPFL